MLAWLLAPLASAVGGVLAGPIGQEPPTSSGVQLSVSPQDEATFLVLAVHVASGADDLAVLWPAFGLDRTTTQVLEPDWFERIEVFTRPRVEDLRCGELVEVVHWGIPPGCGSTGYVAPEPVRGEDALEDLPLGVVWADVDLYVEVVDAAAVATWLSSRELALDDATAQALEPWLDAGAQVLAIRPQTPVPADTWLPPVRFAVGPGDVTLPLLLGKESARTSQELVVYGVAPKERGDAALANYPRGLVEDDCVLPPDTAAPDWFDTSLAEAQSASTLPVWIPEYGGSAGACDPCTSEPLEAFEVGDFGLPAEPEDARVSRLRMRWEPQWLDQDPVVVFQTTPSEGEFPGPEGGRSGLLWYAHDPDLAFAFPTCGGDGPTGGGGSCPDLDPPDGRRSCATGSAPAGLALVAAVVALRRRRTAASALLLCLAGSAWAADASPRTEVHGALSVAGTDRVVPEGVDHGAPWLLNPFLGVEVRRALAAVGGTNVGVLAALRGWTGDAAPGARGVVGFTFLEPAVSLDLRHGRFREGSPCWRGRYGAGLAVPRLHHGVVPAETALGVLFHAGYGAWVGRGLRRTSIELRASVLPRTDGYETRFAPEVGVPGWLFLPGTANLWVVVGPAFW